MLTVASLRKETRWNEAIVRNLLANLRTTGVKGFRESCIAESQLADEILVNPSVLPQHP